MPKMDTNTRPKPILKPKQQQLSFSITNPQPPTVSRELPLVNRDNSSRNPRRTRDKKSLKQAIDYDKLTPTQQLKWDAGIYGCIHLRTDVKKPYYCLRWTDPTTKSRRSTKLAHTYDEAISKLKQLTIAGDAR
jgi:hypothetical protein